MTLALLYTVTDELIN